uniref:Zranb2 protein n=1 Tax=Mus musculus TaxID=10090 RepID=Q05BD8_MOUSE|nr:Zranb2 protein [Mus musculus]
MKMMLISQNIILMPAKKKIVTKRKAIGGAAQSHDRLTQGLHHAHPPPQVQGPGPGPVQEALPVRSPGLTPVPENIPDPVVRNQDPAPGPTGALLPQEKDLIRVLRHLLKETGRGVALDLLHQLFAKKDERDHGHPKGTTGRPPDQHILVPVQVQKRNNVLKFTSLKNIEYSA